MIDPNNRKYTNFGLTLLQLMFLLGTTGMLIVAIYKYMH